jgi:hypothetical protein
MVNANNEMLAEMALDSAVSYFKLMDDYGVSVEDVAKAVETCEGDAWETLYNRLDSAIADYAKYTGIEFEEAKQLVARKVWSKLI